MNRNEDNRPIRVAQIMGKLWAGGVEAVVFNYYREIDKTLVQFDFFYDADSTVEPPQELIDMGARFYKIPPYQKLLSYSKVLKGYFKKYKYTIVHSHINTLSVFPLFIAWREHIPVRIAHNHSVPGGRELSRNILKYILRLFCKCFSTDYFACSEKAGRWMFGDRCFDGGKVTVIKNAVDFHRFRPDAAAIDRLKAQIGVESKFVVGHVGRFTYAKNHKFLLDIFDGICKVKKNAVLLLVGDGELHDEITAWVHKRNLDDKVLFTGNVSNPENYYCIADVMVIPSVFEGLSMTTVESQIAGTPVVISEAIPREAVISDGCIRCKLSDGVSGWANAALEISKKELVINEKGDEYDITARAPILARWYIETYNSQ